MTRERLARTGAASLAGSAFAAASAFILAATVGRGYGTTGAGVFFQVVGLFTVVAHVLRLGADTGLVRSLARQEALGRGEDVRRTVVVALVPVTLVGILTSVLMWFAAPDLAAIFSSEEQQAVVASSLRWLAPFVALPALIGVLLAGTRGLGAVAPFIGLQNVAVPLSRLALVTVAIAAGFGVEGALQLWAVGLPLWTIIAAGLLARMLARMRTAPGPVRRTPERRLWTEFWTFSTPRGVSAALEIMLEWADVLIVAAFRSAAEAGVYAVATRCVRAGQVVDQALRVTVGPRIASDLAVDDLPAARRLYTSATGVLVTLTWPFYLTLAVMGPAVLSLFGPGFESGAHVLALLSAVMMLVAAAGMLQSLLLMGGRSSWQMGNKALALFLSISLNLALVPPLGITGAALAWAVVALVDVTLAAWQVHTRLDITLSWSAIRFPMLLTLVFFLGGGALVRLALGPTLPGLAVTVLVLGGSYLAVCWRQRERLTRGLVTARSDRPRPAEQRS